MPIGFKDTTDAKKSTTQPRTGGLYDTGGNMNAGLGGSAAASIGGNQTRLPRPTQNPNIQNQIGAATTSSGAQQFGQPMAAAVPTTSAPPPSNMGNINGGMRDMVGWANQMGYTGADVMGMNQMPARYLYDILASRGLDPTGGLFYMMEPLADVMMPLYELAYGHRNLLDPQSGESVAFDPNHIANWMGQFWSDMQTPGGQMPNINALMQGMLGTTGQDSVLGSYLNTGTPEEQIENLRRYMMMLGQLTGSPMYGQALSNQLSQGGYDYLNAFQGGQQPTQTFGQSLRGGLGF